MGVTTTAIASAMAGAVALGSASLSGTRLRSAHRMGAPQATLDVQNRYSNVGAIMVLERR